MINKLPLWILFLLLISCGESGSIDGFGAEDSSSNEGNVNSSSSVDMSSSSNKENADSSDSADASSSSIKGNVDSSSSVDMSSSSNKENADSSDSADVSSSSIKGNVDSSSSVDMSSSSNKENADSSDSFEVISGSSNDESSSSVVESSGICHINDIDNCVYGTLYDNRDGSTYKTVQIGAQLWMAENINYNSEKSRCFNDDDENCKKYGRLYIFSEAKKICPDGWKLPGYSDWTKLTSYVKSNINSDEYVGQSLRAESGWNETGTGKGKNYFGFNILAGGYYESLKYRSEGYYTDFWEDYIDSDDKSVFVVTVRYDVGSIGYGDLVVGHRSRNYLYNISQYAATSTGVARYVRCIKD